MVRPRETVDLTVPVGVSISDSVTPDKENKVERLPDPKPNPDSLVALNRAGGKIFDISDNE